MSFRGQIVGIMNEARKGASQGAWRGWISVWVDLLVVAALEKVGVWRVGNIQRHLDVLKSQAGQGQRQHAGTLSWDGRDETSFTHSVASREVEGSGGAQANKNSAGCKVPAGQGTDGMVGRAELDGYRYIGTSVLTPQLTFRTAKSDEGVERSCP